MTLDRALQALVGLMIFLTLLAMGLALAPSEVGQAARRWRLLALGLALNFIAVPALMLLLVRLFGIDGPVAVGLVLCAAAPGGGVGTLFVDYARADVGLSVAVLLGLTFSSAVVTPSLMGWWSGADVGTALGATTWPMVRLILAFQVAPLTLGLALRRYAERFARRAQPHVARIARGLLLAVIAAYLIARGELFFANGLLPLAVSAVSILCSFAFGWLALGLPPRERVALGLTTMTRNLSLAMLLAATVFTQPATLVAVLAYALMMFAAAFAVAAGFRRRA